MKANIAIGRATCAHIQHVCELCSDQSTVSSLQSEISFYCTTRARARSYITALARATGGKTPPPPGRRGAKPPDSIEQEAKEQKSGGFTSGRRGCFSPGRVC